MFRHVAACTVVHHVIEIFRGLRILFGRLAKELFLDNPHAYNLCSFGGFVKLFCFSVMRT